MMIGARVSIYLAASGKSLVSLAKSSDIDAAEIRRMVRGKKTKPGRLVQERLAKAMGLSLREFRSPIPTFTEIVKRRIKE